MDLLSLRPVWSKSEFQDSQGCTEKPCLVNAARPPKDCVIDDGTRPVVGLLLMSADLGVRDWLVQSIDSDLEQFCQKRSILWLQIIIEHLLYARYLVH